MRTVVFFSTLLILLLQLVFGHSALMAAVFGTAFGFAVALLLDQLLGAPGWDDDDS